MDFDKYYSIDDDGNYNLHFANKAKFTVPEIKKIFSSFGRVVSVNVTSEETGLRFVKYKTLRETINCLKGIQMDSRIQMLPEKLKPNGPNRHVNKRDSSGQQAARMENSFKKPFNNGKQSSSNSIYDENSSSIADSWDPIRTDNEPDNYQNSMHDHKPNLNAFKRNEVDSLVFNGKSSLPSRQQTSMEHNSSDTINYEKYYRLLRDGAYTIHFSNKKGLNLDEVKELFAPYANGNDVSPWYGKINSAFVFVRYETEEEVKRAIQAFHNSHEISILLQKDKKEKMISETKNTDQRSSNQWQAARTEGTSQKVHGAGKQFHSNSSYNEKFSECGEKPTSDWDKYKNTENFSDTASRSSRQNWKFNANEIKNENISPQTSKEKYSFSRQQNPISNEGYNHVMRENQQETKFYPSIKTKANTKLDRNMRVSTQDYKIPALISDTDIKPKEFDAVSDCSLSSEIRNSPSKFVVIPMQEIIVANIHTNYGIHYILHLLEKYGPISATLVKTIPETNIRYCHVYFKSMHEAVAVEEEFDNFDLSGKNLIVLRKSRLIDETV